MNPVQTFMTSTFLRSIVGTVLIDFICLVRRRKLHCFHRLIGVLLLVMLITCTVGGARLDLPSSYYVFSWTVGVATAVVIASCHLGACLSERMHRKTFLSVFTVSKKLLTAEKESRSQRATGKTMLEHVVGLLKQMGASLEAVDLAAADGQISDTILRLSTLQMKCLSVLTSGRDVYAVNWLSPEVPAETQVVYKKFVEPHVLQQVLATKANPQGREDEGLGHQPLRCAPVCVTPFSGPDTTDGHISPGPREAALNTSHPFATVDIPLTIGLPMPEILPVPQTYSFAVGDSIPARTNAANEDLAFKTGIPASTTTDDAKSTIDSMDFTKGHSIGTRQSDCGVFYRILSGIKTSFITHHPTLKDDTKKRFWNGGSSRKHCGINSDAECGPGNSGDSQLEGSVAQDDQNTGTCDASSTQERQEVHGYSPTALPQWAGNIAESNRAIEEIVENPSFQHFADSIGSTWTVDIFHLDESTEGNVRRITSWQCVPYSPATYLFVV